MGLRAWVKRLVARRIMKEVLRKMPFLQKLIGNNLAGVLGVVQLLVPLIRELVIVIIRIIDTLFPGRGLEPLIVLVSKIGNKLEAGIVWVKDTFLGRVET